MSWLRRLSRDRDAASKYSPQQDLQPSHLMSRSSRPQTSYGDKDAQAAPLKDSQFPSTHNSQDMLQSGYKRRTHGDTRHFSLPPELSNNNAPDDVTVHTAPTALAPAPDPLTRAFNEALRPYLEQIDALQASLEDANAQVEQLEKERNEMHAWIDKRGLRPDLPTALSSTLSSTPLAASTLSSQLDRKMSMLNYSLHHLADSLPTSLPQSTVTSTLSTLLPSITHLGTLASGPASAFESLIKLAGNANSHSTGEESPEDRRSVADFYNDLDNHMVDVVRRRVRSGEEWDVARDVARLEKTGAFLRREIKLENYFVRGLETMRTEGKWGGGEGVTRYSDESR